MEATLPRRRVQHLIRASAVSLLVAAQSGAVVHAGTVFGNGGALELTQQLNHIELITNAINTANTVKNTLQTYVALKQQLQQLNPATIAQLVGVPVDTINQLAGLYNGVSTVMNDYQQVQQLLQQAQSESNYMGMSPWQYLQFRAQLATKLGGVYQQSFLTDQSKLQNLETQAKQLQVQASQIPGVTSEVQGMQSLLGSNLQVASMMASLNESVARANMIADQKAANDQSEQSAQFNAQLAHYQDLQNKYTQSTQAVSNMNMPNPMTIPTTTGASAN